MTSRILDPREKERARSPAPMVAFQAEALAASREFRKEYVERLNVVLF
jgi:hypothetical protein